MNVTSPFQQVDCISISPEEISVILPTYRLMEHLNDEQKKIVFTPEGQTFVMGGNWDGDLKEKFENGGLYKGLKEHVQSGVEWPQTTYYKRKLRRVKDYRRAVRDMNREH